MASYIFYSYLSATLAYGFLFLLALFNKHRFTPFILAAGVSLVWTGSIVLAALGENQNFVGSMRYETLRDAAWFFLISILLSRQGNGTRYGLLLQSRISYFAGIFILCVFCIEIFPGFRDFIQWVFKTPPRLFAHLLFSVFGLILVEQLYRNTPLKQRWHIKFLCIGLAALFLVDLIVYSKSLLFVRLDFTLWQSRGVINALVMPLLAISVNRMEIHNDHLGFSTPRKTVFYTTFLLGCCIYLFLMSIVGFYIKNSNAIWGEAAQTLFIFLAILLLTIAFTSGKIRALVKIYFSKHFFHYSYDYREEWLKISRSLAKLESLEDLKGFILNTLIELVESTGGGLWLKNRQGQFCLAAEQNLGFTPQTREQPEKIDELSVYLNKKQWVIDFYELAHAPEIYADIDLSSWCDEADKIWLIIPLFHLNNLEAFVVLTQSKVPRKLDWEDHDLLKTVGMQLANALALNKASEELANNRQFEAYHRLSAYLVHDLKNLVAQISLIVKNAEKHKHNPEFFDDTIDTLNNVTKKMHHIVEQLKQGEPGETSDNIVSLAEIIQDIARHRPASPSLQILMSAEDCLVKADSIKLTSILTNLVQNAVDATNQSGGWVRFELEKQQDYAVIKIIDNGIGMSQTFIAERLFKPFDTTKGNAGMGIGAYEARDYVLKLGGEINVHSQPSQGSVFTVRLPLATMHDK
ncbi:MAG: PEP-CTERM system histidine kinase PrsK [Methylococcales bacterium]|nr:PEP-CTERM system histidine kinase PrsK [Methylococcales bacterium]